MILRPERWAILGAGCSFAIETTLHLGRLGKRVIGIGRSRLGGPAFERGVKAIPGYSYHVAHLTYDRDRVLGILDEFRPEVIVNFAAQGESAASWTDSWRYFETNCVGLTHLVEELATRDYLQRFIQIGASEVYGSVTEPAGEDAPIRPTSPYAASKAAFDSYLLALQMVKGFPAIVIRPSNAYAPGQQLHRIIPKTVVSGVKGIKVPLYGGGENRKSYIHFRDVARVISMAAEHAAPGSLYNVAPPAPVSTRDVVAACAEALDMDLDDLAEVVERPADRPGQDACYWFDSSRIRDDLGFRPEIGMAEGLSEMVAWARENAAALELPTEPYRVRP